MSYSGLKYTFFTALASVFMGACSDSQLEELAPETEKGCSIAFGSQLTKAPVTDVKSMNDFKVWGWAHKDQTYKQLFDGTKVYASTGLYEGSLRFWEDGFTHDFFALHPYSLQDAAVTNQGQLTVSYTGEKVGKDAVDLMTASKTGINYTFDINATQAPVALSFSHELALVEFEVKALQNASVTAKLYGLSHTGRLTKAYMGTPPDWTSSWILGTANTDVNTPFSNGALEVPANNRTGIFLLNGTMLLPPQILLSPSVDVPEGSSPIQGATLLLAYTYADGHEVTKKISLANVKGMNKWEAGKRYHYDILIPKRTFEVNITVSVTDWNNKDISTIL